MSDIESRRLRRRKVLKGAALRAGRGATPAVAGAISPKGWCVAYVKKT